MTSSRFTSLHFIPLHFTSLHFTSLHFSSLHFTSLHFTSLLLLLDGPGLHSRAGDPGPCGVGRATFPCLPCFPMGAVACSPRTGAVSCMASGVLRGMLWAHVEKLDRLEAAAVLLRPAGPGAASPGDSTTGPHWRPRQDWHAYQFILWSRQWSSRSHLPDRVGAHARELVALRGEPATMANSTRRRL